MRRNKQKKHKIKERKKETTSTTKHIFTNSHEETVKTNCSKNKTNKTTSVLGIEEALRAAWAS